MMMKKSLTIALLLVFLICALGGCRGGSAPVEIAAPTQGPASSAAPPVMDETKLPMVIGLRYDDDADLLCAEQAVTRINAAGGIHGRTLQLRAIEASGWDLAATKDKAAFYADADMIAVIDAASYGSVNVIAACEEAKMPVFHAAGATEACNGNLFSYVCHTSPSLQQNYMMQFDYMVNHLGAKRIAVIRGTLGTDDVIEYANALAKKTGKFEVVADCIFPLGTEADWSFSIGKQILDAGADCILYATNDVEGAMLLRGLYANCGVKLPAVSGSGMVSGTAPEIAGYRLQDKATALNELENETGWWPIESLSCAVWGVPLADDPADRDLIDAYRAQYGAIPSASRAGVYDTVLIIAEALRQGATRDNLAGWVRNEPGLHEGTFTADGLIAGDGVMFDRNGHIVSGPYSVLQVNGSGEFYESGTVDGRGFGAIDGDMGA